MEFITTFLFSQQNSFQQNFPTKTYTGDNMVHCNKCNKKTEETIVSFDLKLKPQTVFESNYMLVNTVIKIYSV